MRIEIGEILLFLVNEKIKAAEQRKRLKKEISCYWYGTITGGGQPCDSN